MDYDLGPIGVNAFLVIVMLHILFTFGASLYLFFFSPLSRTVLTFFRPFYSLEGGTETLICFVAFIPHFLVWAFFYAGMVWWISWAGWLNSNGGITLFDALCFLLAVIAPWFDALLGVDFNRIALLVAGEGILGMLLSLPALFRYLGPVFSFKDLLGYLWQTIPVILGLTAFVPMFVDALSLGIVGDPLHDIRWYAFLVLGSLGTSRAFRSGIRD